MRVYNLTENSTVYTSNAYLVLGAWNTLHDVTTLVDVGNDKSIVDMINGINTGLGKRKVDQVVITHSHSDHTAMLPAIISAFNPKVFAFNSHVKGIHRSLADGDHIRIGDSQFEVIHTPVHSYDSICLFCKDNGMLFVGDTPFPANFQIPCATTPYPERLLRSWQHVKTIYPGHGAIRHRPA
jgi:glyoxylase-like metal-dependent hydrolase (beta-lactamase superfamily II)